MERLAKSDATPTQECVIVGIDEAGRGPLAGPVVAAACVLPCPVFKRRRNFSAWSPFQRIRDDDCVIADSKALDDAEREAAYGWIVAHCPYGVAMSSAADIDEFGILAATERAMREAVTLLSRLIEPTHLLIDGNDKFSFAYPHTSIIRGDGIEPAIAAASIIAKVTRDRLMRAEADRFPQYGFGKHKGYGTNAHRNAVLLHGPCILHRRTFLKKLKMEN
jgi:ribonuclease HII